MDNEVYYKVIAPTLSTGAAFIGITTKGEEDSNFVSQLIETKDKNGDKLFNVIDFEESCEKCKKLGKELTCNHLTGQIPPWQTQSDRERVKNALSGHDATYLLEMKGIQTNNLSKPAFSKESVERLRDKECEKDIKEYYNNVFVSIDPAAGGEKSKYAIVSAVYSSHKMLVSLINSVLKFSSPIVLFMFFSHNCDITYIIWALSSFDSL